MHKKILFIALFSLFFILTPTVLAETFNRDLKFGMQSDPDVVRLQEFLRNENLYTGPITGNFFTLTQKAVIDFQKQEEIEPALGYFGPITRAAANMKVGENVSNPPLNQPASFQLKTPETPKSVSIQKIETTALQSQINALMEQVKILQQQIQQQSQAQQPASNSPTQPNSGNLTILQNQSTNLTTTNPNLIPDPETSSTPTSPIIPFGTVVPGSIISL